MLPSSGRSSSPTWHQTGIHYAAFKSRKLHFPRWEAFHLVKFLDKNKPHFVTMWQDIETTLCTLWLSAVGVVKFTLKRELFPTRTRVASALTPKFPIDSKRSTRTSLPYIVHVDFSGSTSILSSVSQTGVTGSHKTHEISATFYSGTRTGKLWDTLHCFSYNLSQFLEQERASRKYTS